ncbi:MAG: hypothetical protein ACO3K7_01235 [Candidatus Marinamargulisbacteria bacterium]
MPAKRNNITLYIIINALSFIILIINLNFNVRTFRLTQELQTLTINLQALEAKVQKIEHTYYVATSLDKIYEKARNELGMHRPSQPNVFVNTTVESR